MLSEWWLLYIFPYLPGCQQTALEHLVRLPRAKKLRQGERIHWWMRALVLDAGSAGSTNEHRVQSHGVLRQATRTVYDFWNEVLYNQVSRVASFIRLASRSRAVLGNCGDTRLGRTFVDSFGKFKREIWQNLAYINNLTISNVFNKLTTSS